ncbi:MAG: hypothetical protein H6Q17_336 [Bacteroidetes bacterium]|nr:hypothetical protein [Bacteroidota bacterium]
MGLNKAVDSYLLINQSVMLMGTAKVVKTFSSAKYTDSGLDVKAGYIIERMTGNGAYPNPAPSLESLKLQVKNYHEALLNTQGGGKAETVIKNSLRKQLEEALSQEADYVQVASGGDEATILSSGFDVRKKSSTVGMLDKPTGFVVKMGENKGSVVALCDAVDYADFYEFSYTHAPVTATSVWETKTTTKRSTIINGLTSGAEMAFRVAGAGSDLSRVYSNVIVTYVV